MYSQDPSVSDILENYLKEERKLEIKIEQCTKRSFDLAREDKDAESSDAVAKNNHIDYEKSKLRNEKFLKDLEEAKARLRTIASYTPTDQELRVLAGAYRGLLGNVAQSRSQI